MFFKVNYFYTCHCDYSEKRSDFSVNFSDLILLTFRLAQRKSWATKRKFVKFSRSFKLARDKLWQWVSQNVAKIIKFSDVIKRGTSSTALYGKTCKCRNRQTLMLSIKVAATDMRYFIRSKFWRSLVHKKNFGLMWLIIFTIEYFFQGR